MVLDREKIGKGILYGLKDWTLKGFSLADSVLLSDFEDSIFYLEA